MQFQIRNIKIHILMHLSGVSCLFDAKLWIFFFIFFLAGLFFWWQVWNIIHWCESFEFLIDTCGSDSAVDDLGSFRGILCGMNLSIYVKSRNLVTQDINYPHLLKKRPSGCWKPLRSCSERKKSKTNIYWFTEHIEK